MRTLCLCGKFRFFHIRLRHSRARLFVVISFLTTLRWTQGGELSRTAKDTKHAKENAKEEGVP